MARKYSKGKKPEETMRQRQQRLLREQRARKAAQTNVKSTPDPNPAKRGAQGPRNAPSQGPERKPVSAMQGDTGRTGATDPQGRAKNQPAKPAPRNAPPTQKYKPRVSNVGPQIRQRQAIEKTNQARRVAKANPGRTNRAARNARFGSGGLIGALTTGAQIGEAMRQNLPRKATPSNRGTGRATDNVRPGPPAKTETPSRKNGQRATLNGKPVVWRNGKWVPAPSQSAGKYNTKDADGTVRSKAKVEPKKVGPKKVGTIAQSFDRSYAAPKKPEKATPKTAKQRAYATDSRNKEYDRLRKAGKIKEATALGKKINEDKLGKKKKKNPNESIRKAAQSTYNRGSA